VRPRRRQGIDHSARLTEWRRQDRPRRDLPQIQIAGMGGACFGARGKPPRKIESCAALGPKSQGETAISPAGFFSSRLSQRQWERHNVPACSCSAASQSCAAPRSPVWNQFTRRR
jgi:hypothetical protein